MLELNYYEEDKLLLILSHFLFDFLLIAALIIKNTGGVEKKGAISGAIILPKLNTLTSNIIMDIFSIYSKI